MALLMSITTKSEASVFVLYLPMKPIKNTPGFSYNTFLKKKTVLKVKYFQELLILTGFETSSWKSHNLTYVKTFQYNVFKY